MEASREGTNMSWRDGTGCVKGEGERLGTDLVGKGSFGRPQAMPLATKNTEAETEATPVTIATIMRGKTATGKVEAGT